MSLPEVDERPLPGPTGSSRRRLRRVASAVGLLVVAVLGAVGIRTATSLNGLPVIDDPSLPAVVIPDEENAFTFFRRATDRFVGHESDITRGAGLFDDWSEVPAKTIGSFEANGEALDLWFEGTTRDRALYIDPKLSNMETLLPVTQRLRSFIQLAGLRAMRLRLDGDHAGAWTWVRAGLRCSLLSGQNGFLIERIVGTSLYGEATTLALKWADDPRVETALIRKALDDVLALESLAPAYGPVVLREFHCMMNTTEDRPMLRRSLETPNGRGPRSRVVGEKKWVQAVYEGLRREPERSRRIVRLVTANWLSACDLPDAERSARAMKFGELRLYRPAPGVSPPIALEELARWCETSLYAHAYFAGWMDVEAARNGDEKTRAALIVHLAERLYRRERGSDPPSPDALVGPYLTSLPAGYVQGLDDPKAGGPKR